MPVRFATRAALCLLIAVAVSSFLRGAHSDNDPHINWTPWTTASAEDKQAAAMIDRGDYAGALKILRPLAVRGESKAQLLIGMMYDNGRGVPLDYTEAANWFLQAGDQGDYVAQAYLGVMYARGKGVNQDYEVAAKWLRLSANQNYFGGQEGLGLLYEYGKGVPLDNVQAYLWYGLAAKRIPDSYEKERADVIGMRDRVSSRMTPDQIAQAKKLVSEWKPPRH